MIVWSHGKSVILKVLVSDMFSILGSISLCHVLLGLSHTLPQVRLEKSDVKFLIPLPLREALAQLAYRAVYWEFSKVSFRRGNSIKQGFSFYQDHFFLYWVSEKRKQHAVICWLEMEDENMALTLTQYLNLVESLAQL